MNKVLQINLGGYPFTIDEDAYKQLDAYIKNIRQHFAGKDAYEEITTDIEARLAELFQQRLENRPIVSVKDVEDVIARMGRPEEFGADSIGDDDSTEESTGGSKSEYKTGKRLFRNPDETVIAGVCSGIAAYFGISDPIWVRLAFVLIALSGGFGVPIYLILWAIVPKAVTASDRLAMRGEPINVSNIGKIIQEEFENISKKVSEFSEEMTNKDKKEKFSADLDYKLDFRINQAVDGIGDFLRKAFNSLGAIWKPILFIIAIVLIIMLLAAWVSAIFAAFVSPPLVQHFFPEHTGMASMGFISMMFVVGIPLLLTALGIFRLVFGTRVSSAWRVSLAVFWAMNLGFIFFLGSAGVAQFAEKASTEHRLTMDEFNSDTINLEIIDNTDNRRAVFSWLDDDDIILPPVETTVKIRKSEDEKFYIDQEVSSLGSNYQEASELLDGIELPFELEGNTLKLKNWISVKEGSKWRNQKVDLTIYVPEGKYLHALPWPHTNSLRISGYYEDRNTTLYSFIRESKVWQMKADGLACTDCFQEQEKEEEKELEEKILKEEEEKLSMIEE
ncbi:PspC domain-containing protein [Flavilitoribacter nigricans]|uniref:Uncharacterized protein n=1 Tax=Flavilitoribacter nigricans (strain ATCC 23147 / DSM 23189 / NBRC 102662 / NCIMB 1420 / SS-2) TaxID=1122177 RepID=A0A2D0NHV2_FLAN2|nr:PspC domain-containing protein [Flavilitoribacter nigricans]PHN08075.1 hypothetical protein CRP01_03405 [Flavilitoribacter nigricans DSM 23189 = NBRC 102662]